MIFKKLLRVSMIYKSVYNIHHSKDNETSLRFSKWFIIKKIWVNYTKVN